MIINGDVIEVGELEGEGGQRGFVIHRADGTFVTVKGLTEDEARAAAQVLFASVALRLAAAPPSEVPP